MQGNGAWLSPPRSEAAWPDSRSSSGSPRENRRDESRQCPAATLAAFPPDGLDDLVADYAFEITRKRNLVPRRPGRRYAKKTKRAGGRHKTCKPGQTARLTPLTGSGSG
jgi:hypothetical protein